MQPSSLAFTTRYSEKTRILFSEIQIAHPFAPSSTPKPLSPVSIPKSLSPEKYRGIWDTGATGSAITQKVIDDVGLKPTGMVKVNTASQKGVPTEVYLVSVFLPNRVCIPQLKVTRANLVGTEVLLGMDIISQGDFAVTNENGKTVLSYRLPSTTCLDFVKEQPSTIPQITKPPGKISRNAPCPCGSGKKYKKCCGK